MHAQDDKFKHIRYISTNARFKHNLKLSDTTFMQEDLNKTRTKVFTEKNPHTSKNRHKDPHEKSVYNMAHSCHHKLINLS